MSDLSDISAMKENGNILVEKKMDGFAEPKLFFLLSSYRLIYTEAADHFSQGKTVMRATKYQRTVETNKCSCTWIRWGSQKGGFSFQDFVRKL